ncbi:MAG TPA: ATP synthase F1 subunit gamma [Puia sp.]|nr:ATP synthase F1 subunit gamma [Puia sp.]
MPGQLKEVRNRIKSIQSTQQITKAMKMISATKLRKAQDAIIQLRPYARKLRQLVVDVVNESEDNSTVSSLSVVRPVEKVLFVVVTSDRGSCGAYNSNIIKLTKATINEKYASQAAKGNVSIWPIGKKGYEHFIKIKSNYTVNPAYRDIFLHLNYENVQACAQAVIKGFQSGEFDAIEVVYSEFVNAASQRFISNKVLPLQKEPRKPGERKRDFIIEPSHEQLIEVLMPYVFNTQMYRIILEANASEHGARMTAMDKATENANELLRTLRISYNRARQAAITTELTEIVSGAAALQG